MTVPEIHLAYEVSFDRLLLSRSTTGDSKGDEMRILEISRKIHPVSDMISEGSAGLERCRWPCQRDAQPYSKPKG